MIDLFLQGGLFMYPLLILGLVILGISVKKAWEIINYKDQNIKKIEAGLNGIIFWGVIAAIIGVLGQVSGIYEALKIILSVPDISPPIILKGFGMSFITTLFGLWILVIAALIWKFLKILLMKKFN